MRTPLTASLAGMKCPSTVAIVPDARSALASRVRTPAARAISLAVKTSVAVAVVEDMEVAGQAGAKRLPRLSPPAELRLPVFRPLFVQAVAEVKGRAVLSE
jgi:hypothetical protein